MAKVLIVIARLNVGGTAQYIGELAKHLPKKGYEVLVATGNVQGSEIEDEIANQIPIKKIASLGRKISPLNDLKARSELKKLIKEYQPDLIYSHTFKAGALTRTIKTEIPIIHAFHGHLIDEPELAGLKVKIVMAIERRLAKKARYLVTVGEKVAAELLEAGVGNPAQYVSIAPGVYPLKLENQKSAREELELTEEKRPIVAWLARVVAVKAPQRVIELARAIPEARFILAGGGDLLDSIRKDAPANLSVLGWQEAKRVWAVANIAISTSENEGMPVAQIEAQLAGLPIVALNVGSVAEVIEDKVTGYVLTEFGDGYIDRLRSLVADKSLRRELGEKARVRSERLFAPERLISDHEKLFQRLL